MINLKSFLLPFTFILFMSCSSKKSANTSTENNNSMNIKLQNDKLKGFMLGGIYFVTGYGGLEATAKMVGDGSNDELIKNYAEIFEFPFEKGQADEAMKNMFSHMWSINNKEDLINTLEKLKTNDPKSTHKAWDYSRLVNNVCMGYAVGYITKAQGEKYVADVLPLAQQKFKNWDDYFADFNAGRKAWNDEDENAKEFEELSTTITKTDKSIYKIIPLN